MTSDVGLCQVVGLQSAFRRAQQAPLEGQAQAATLRGPYAFSKRAESFWRRRTVHSSEASERRCLIQEPSLRKPIDPADMLPAMPMAAVTCSVSPCLLYTSPSPRDGLLSR